MLDFYKMKWEDGSIKGRYDDIDLLENRKFDVSGAPSPKEIKYKKKMDYIPRTIRINEFADASLKILAEECNMDINKLVNAIFDGYINKHQDEIGGGILVKEYVLNAYLDRLTKELDDKKLSADKKKWERTIRHEEEPVVMENGDKYGENFARQYFGMTIFKPLPETSEAYYKKVDKQYWQHLEYYGCDFELFMPEKKWFTVMSILDRYYAKCNALGIKERKVDEDAMQKLVRVINNSKTNKTILKNLTNALKHSHRSFREREGSIWSALS